MNIAEFIADFKNHPILFIGTGFSLRYLENSYNWDGLLKHICLEVTGNNEVFLDIKSQSQNQDGSFNYEDIASKIEIIFNESLSNNRNGKFKFINDIFYDNMENNINLSRFKIYISHIFNHLSYRQEKLDEITELKKVRKNIGSIITTNYDKLVEDIFQFTPLIGNDILLSDPYGSVYKIHGCTSQPDKIIISKNDYQEFDKKYELIRAQLLSLFIHNPIIFIGYSVSDENIRKLLKTIFTYVPANSEIADKIKANFLLVEYEKDESSTEISDYDIELIDKTNIRVNRIKTDNFTAIYNALASIDLPISAMDIRKVQKVIREIYEGGDIQVKIVDDIDNLLNNEKVLAIGNVNRISYEYQKTGEMISNYFKIIDEDNKPLLKLIEKHTINKAQYFPIFAFSKINTTISTAPKLKEQQIDKLKELRNNIKDVCKTDHTQISEILNDTSISTSNKNYAIIYSIINGRLNLADVEQFLVEYEPKDTAYKRMLCAYDFMKYSNGETL